VLENRLVLGEFTPEGFAGFMELVPMVQVLHRLLKRNGYEKADGNGSNVDEEAFPRVNRFMGSVNIKHRS